MEYKKERYEILPFFEINETYGDALKCPTCYDDMSYIHIKMIGVARDRHLYTEYNGKLEILGTELTHGDRDKVFIHYQCETCDYPLILVQVNHEGVLSCGLYKLNSGVNLHLDNLIVTPIDTI